MDAARQTRPAARRSVGLAALLTGPFTLAVAAYGTQTAGPPPAPKGAATAAPGTRGAAAPSSPKSANPLVPDGDGTRDLRDPQWSTDPFDPSPMPPELANVNLLAQTESEAQAKSTGCVNCHRNTGDPHDSPDRKKTFRLGCTDCHGGDATCDDKYGAHIRPRFPQLWPTSGNPVRSYALLNHDSPEFIRFVN